MLQIQVGLPQQSGPFGALPLSSIAGSAIFYIVLDLVTLIVLLFGLLFFIRLLLHRRRVTFAAFQKVILLVTVPKESADAEEHEETIETIRNQISLAESWLATLGGMRAQRGFYAWLFGRNDHFSFEIVSHAGLISFYVAAPQHLRTHIEQQLLAQYPEANVTEVEDYNVFAPQGAVKTAYLKLTQPSIFPINTYRRLNTDPLNALANSLSQVKPGDGVAIQIIARSAHKRWHTRGSRVATLLRSGKTLKEALSETSNSAFGTIGQVFRPTKKRDDRTNADNQPRQVSVQEELVSGLEGKTGKAGLDCNVRIIASGQTDTAAQNYVRNVADAFSQFNYYQYGNSFRVVTEDKDTLAPDFIYRNFRNYQGMVLNTEELASIFHLPTPFLDTPNIRWLLAKKLPAPPNLPQEGLLLGQNAYRGGVSNIYLAPDDRRRHVYMIGMTGTGKSVLVANMARQDIAAGHGVCVIDPHGSLVEEVLRSVPPQRRDDVIYFNPSDTDRPVGINLLDAKTPEQQDFAVQEMIAIFYKLVTDPSMIGPMFEHNIRNAMLTLMADRDNPGTIVEIPRMFTDAAFQRLKVANVTDPIIRSFWEQEMAKTSDFHKSEMLGYIISKVGRFIENAMIRNIIGQAESSFNFREVMDQKKILLVNLSKGTIGEVNSNLLGLIIVAKLQMAAMARAEAAEESRPDFYLYIDEFQNFITDSIATILAEARKYRLNLILAHQYVGQLTEGAGVEGKSFGNKIKDAIFGNVGTLIAFRIGSDDAETIEKQLAPLVDQYDLLNIERFNAYVRLLVDNQPVKPFTIRTFPPGSSDPTIAQHIKEVSRFRYGVDRRQVDADVIRRSQLGTASRQPGVERTL